MERKKPEDIWRLKVFSDWLSWRLCFKVSPLLGDNNWSYYYSFFTRALFVFSFSKVDYLDHVNFFFLVVVKAKGVSISINTLAFRCEPPEFCSTITSPHHWCTVDNFSMLICLLVIPLHISLSFSLSLTFSNYINSLSEQKWTWTGPSTNTFPWKDTNFYFWCSDGQRLGSIESPSEWFGWCCSTKSGTRGLGEVFTSCKQVSLVKWRLLLWTECTNYNHLHLLVGSVLNEFLCWMVMYAWIVVKNVC